MNKTDPLMSLAGSENLFEALRALRLPTPLQLAERLAPEWTASWAARQFMTPPRYAAPKAERELLGSGHRFTIATSVGRLAAWSWGVGPTVFLMHGWAGRGGQMAPFVHPLLQAGFSVVLFDAPAHGQSEGREASLLHFRDALIQVINQHGPAHAVIAHSMGCGSTALALISGLRVPRLVFIGSPTDPSPYAERFVSHLRLGQGTFSAMTAKLERRFGVRWSELSVPALASSRREALLLVHDREDRDAPFEGALEIARHWPGARLMTTEGLGHRRVLRSPEVIAQAITHVSGNSA